MIEQLQMKKNSGETTKQLFWKTSIKYQRPKLRMKNVMVFKGLVDAKKT